MNRTYQDSALSPDASNATFALNAGDMAVVTLRVVHGGDFQPGDAAAVVLAHAPDTGADAPSAAVYDRTPPVITLPDPIFVEATGSSGATVTYEASAHDALDGDVAVSCSPASGSIFPIGTTTVTCTAADSRGNERTGTFAVTVRDTTGPVISPAPDITVNSTSTAGAVVTYTAPSTFDIVDGAGVATCLPASGSLFPIGVTAVTCTAVDAAGNAATPVIFTVTVVDTIPPVPVAVADPAVLLWSPNRTMVPVTISGTITDDSALVGVTFAVADEYGLIQPSGSVTAGPDGSFSFVVALEAYRNGNDKDGRTYTVTVTATDSAGNNGSASVIVRVPHDQK